MDLGQRSLKRRSWKVVDGVKRDDAREGPRIEGNRANIATNDAAIASATSRHKEHLLRQIHPNHEKSVFGKVLTNLARTTTEVENGLSGSNALDEGIKDLAI